MKNNWKEPEDNSKKIILKKQPSDKYYLNINVEKNSIYTELSLNK